MHELRQKRWKPKEEYMRPGHMGCPGCGLASTIRLVMKVLGKNTIVVMIPSCVGVYQRKLPEQRLRRCPASIPHSRSPHPPRPA